MTSVVASRPFGAESMVSPDLPGVCAIYVWGQVTLNEAPEFRRSMLEKLRATDATKLVVELDRVQHLDTAGVAVLVEVLLVGRERGLQILLCSPSDSVVQLFQFANLEDALAACSMCPVETRRRLMGPQETGGIEMVGVGGSS